MSPAESPLLELTDANLVRALANEAMLGGPDDHDEDDILQALWVGTKPWLLGACGRFAEHLRRQTGKPVIGLECRSSVEQDWILRHAGVITGDVEDAHRMIARGDGLFVPMLDALGRGTFDERLPLYENGDAFRVLLVDSLRPAWAVAYEALPDPLLEFDPIAVLPGVAIAFSQGFDIHAAIAAILETYPERDFHLVQDLDELRRWAFAPSPVA